MNETLHELGIDRLSVAERLDLIGLIWDSLDTDELVLPIPASHLSEVARRRASAEADPDAAIPWEQVKARLIEKS